MKLVRFGPPGEERPGILDGTGIVRDASELVTDWSGSALAVDALSRLSQTDLSQLPKVPQGARLGCPVPTPGKIVCVGLNYADHAAETAFDLPQEPLIFFKSPTALSGPFDPIVLPASAHAVDWEALPASLDMRIWLHKNGQTRQDSRTGSLVFSVDRIVAHLSEFITLLPGDLVLTGTPAGVAYNKPDPDYLKEGDFIECGIEGLGAQRCEVRSAAGPDR